MKSRNILLQFLIQSNAFLNIDINIINVYIIVLILNLILPASTMRNIQVTERKGEFVILAPVVQRADNFIHWISHYPAVSICAKISEFSLVQPNMHTLTTVKLGSVRKPWTTFNVKYILNPE